MVIKHIPDVITPGIVVRGVINRKQILIKKEFTLNNKTDKEFPVVLTNTEMKFKTAAKITE